VRLGVIALGGPNHYIPLSNPLIWKPMRPETERAVDEIQQAIALLRRHL
jgi:hypothetical protein